MQCMHPAGIQPETRSREDCESVTSTLHNSTTKTNSLRHSEFYNYTFLNRWLLGVRISLSLEEDLQRLGGAGVSGADKRAEY